MKIGLVLENLDPYRGGLEQWTWQFAQRLLEAGHQVHVVACDFSQAALALPIIAHRVAPSIPPLERAAAMEELLRGLELEVIHDMGVGWYADIFHPHGGSHKAASEHNLMRIPRWRQFRLWREKRYRDHEQVERRRYAASGGMVVAVSKMVRQHLERLHGLAPERLSLVYNGVDTERFSPGHCAPLREPARAQLGCAKNETIFLVVAHNLKLKNAEAAIRALQPLVQDGKPVRLVLVGGRKPEPFIKLTRKLGLARHVLFLEGVEDVRPYYAAADVCLHPTWYDPCSLVALEALACGLPVVTTRFNGVSELLNNAEHGFILECPGDVAQLSERMLQLLDPFRRRSMSVAARVLVLEHTMERQFREFLALYQTVIARKAETLQQVAGS